MKNTKADRRSQRTKQLLSSALMALLLEKRYVEITVQDIIDRANVGRSTFYDHYLDKDDLLESEVMRVLDLLSDHIRGREVGDVFAQANLTLLFEHVQAHQSLYKALGKGGAIDLVYAKGQDRLRHNIEQHLEELVPKPYVSDIPIALVADYLAGTILQLLRWWLESDMSLTPTQMNRVFVRLTAPGVQAVLHLPSTPLQAA